MTNITSLLSRGVELVAGSTDLRSVTVLVLVNRNEVVASLPTSKLDPAHIHSVIGIRPQYSKLELAVRNRLCPLLRGLEYWTVGVEVAPKPRNNLALADPVP